MFQITGTLSLEKKWPKVTPTEILCMCLLHVRHDNLSNHIIIGGESHPSHNLFLNFLSWFDLQESRGNNPIQSELLHVHTRAHNQNHIRKKEGNDVKWKNDTLHTTRELFCQIRRTRICCRAEHNTIPICTWTTEGALQDYLGNLYRSEKWESQKKSSDFSTVRK